MIARRVVLSLVIETAPRQHISRGFNYVGDTTVSLLQSSFLNHPPWKLCVPQHMSIERTWPQWSKARKGDGSAFLYVTRDPQPRIIKLGKFVNLHVYHGACKHTITGKILARVVGHLWRVGVCVSLKGNPFARYFFTRSYQSRVLCFEISGELVTWIIWFTRRERWTNGIFGRLWEILKMQKYRERTEYVTIDEISREECLS